MTRRLWLVVLAATTVHAAPAVVLQYSYKTGEKVRYRDQVAMAIVSRGFEGGSAKLQYRSDSLLEQQIKKVDGNVFTIETKTLKNKSEITGDDGQTSTDEHKGSPERVRMNARGLVLERVELEPDPNKSDFGYTTKLDEFAIIQQVFDRLTFPPGDIEPGHEWTESFEVDLTPANPKVKTLVKVEPKAVFRRVVLVRGERCAELVTEFEVPLKTPKDEESKELNLTIDGRITGHLTSYFSLTRGRAVVELATLGAVGRMVMAPPGMKRTELGGQLKLNIKTVLEP